MEKVVRDLVEKRLEELDEAIRSANATLAAQKAAVDETMSYIAQLEAEHRTLFVETDTYMDEEARRIVAGSRVGALRRG